MRAEYLCYFLNILDKYIETQVNDSDTVQANREVFAGLDNTTKFPEKVHGQ